MIEVINVQMRTNVKMLILFFFTASYVFLSPASADIDQQVIGINEEDEFTFQLFHYYFEHITTEGDITRRYEDGTFSNYAVREGEQFTMIVVDIGILDCPECIVFDIETNEVDTESIFTPGIWYSLISPIDWENVKADWLNTSYYSDFNNLTNYNIKVRETDTTIGYKQSWSGYIERYGCCPGGVSKTIEKVSIEWIYEKSTGVMLYNRYEEETEYLSETANKDNPGTNNEQRRYEYEYVREGFPHPFRISDYQIPILGLILVILVGLVIFALMRSRDKSKFVSNELFPKNGKEME